MAVIIDNWVECLTTIWMIFDTLTEVNLQLVKKIIYMKVAFTTSLLVKANSQTMMVKTAGGKKRALFLRKLWFGFVSNFAELSLFIHFICQCLFSDLFRYYYRVFPRSRSTDSNNTVKIFKIYNFLMQFIMC